MIAIPGHGSASPDDEKAKKSRPAIIGPTMLRICAAMTEPLPPQPSAEPRGWERIASDTFSQLLGALAAMSLFAIAVSLFGMYADVREIKKDIGLHARENQAIRTEQEDIKEEVQKLKLHVQSIRIVLQGSGFLRNLPNLQ